MVLRFYKPYTSGVRHRSVLFFRSSGVQAKKKLKRGFQKQYGRNHSGCITQRCHSKGHKRGFRVLQARGFIDNVGFVLGCHYDPNRNARLALVVYPNKQQRYMLMPEGLTLGSPVLTSVKAPLSVGNRLPLHSIPLGSLVHDVELYPGGGGVLARSAGTVVSVIAKETKYVSLRLPSGEVRYVLKACWATLGSVGNSASFNTSQGKAGVTRHLGRRPKVRGSAKNPVDHPHGGGEGKAPIGRDYPVSLWGKHALGKRTRRSKKQSSKFILQRRKGF